MTGFSLKHSQFQLTLIGNVFPYGTSVKPIKSCWVGSSSFCPTNPSLSLVWRGMAIIIRYKKRCLPYKIKRWYIMSQSSSKINGCLTYILQVNKMTCSGNANLYNKWGVAIYFTCRHIFQMFTFIIWPFLCSSTCADGYQNWREKKNKANISIKISLISGP